MSLLRPTAAALPFLVACGAKPAPQPVEVDAAKHAVCVTYDDGVTLCDPYNVPTGAADRDTYNEDPRVPVTGVDNAYVHTCGLEADGSLHCWGDQRFYNPYPAGSFVQVVANGENNCALDAEGAAHCWGMSFESELALRAHRWALHHVGCGQLGQLWNPHESHDRLFWFERVRSGGAAGRR